MENSLANQKSTEPDYIIKTETDLSNLQIQYPNQDIQTTPASKYIFNFPKQFNTQEAQLTHINFFKDTNLYLAQNTTLDTLVAKAQEQRVHLKLTQGELIIDSRQTNQSIPSIQTSNVFFQPFTNGIYYISNKNNQVTLGAIQGSFLIGAFDQSGEFQGKVIIHRNQQISFPSAGIDTNELNIESLASIPYIDKFKFSEFLNIDDSILEGELFQLVFKGRTLTPVGENSWQANLQALNFNQTKKNFLTIYPFYQKLEQAKQDIKINQSKNLNTLLVESRQIYNSAITNNPESTPLFIQTANQNLQIISGLSPLSELNSLKVFMSDTFSKHLDSPTALKLSLSLLEDINYGYDNRKPDISIKSEQVLGKVLASQGFQSLSLEDQVNVLVVTDNILSTYPSSYTLELFKARQSIVAAIQAQTQDESLLNSFQATQLQYLQEVVSRGSAGSLESAKAKKIAFYLLDTLPEDFQGDLRSQINTIDN